MATSALMCPTADDGFSTPKAQIFDDSLKPYRTAGRMPNLAKANGAAPGCPSNASPNSFTLSIYGLCFRLVMFNSLLCCTVACHTLILPLDSVVKLRIDMESTRTLMLLSWLCFEE